MKVESMHFNKLLNMSQSCFILGDYGYFVFFFLFCAGFVLFVNVAQQSW